MQTIIPVALGIPEGVEADLKLALPGVKLMGIYGTNETGMLALSDTCKHLGRLRPGVQFKVYWLQLNTPKSRLKLPNHI